MTDEHDIEMQEAEADLEPTDEDAGAVKGGIAKQRGPADREGSGARNWFGPPDGPPVGP